MLKFYFVLANISAKLKPVLKDFDLVILYPPELKEIITRLFYNAA